ncbi:glycosyltransferase [Prolixibacter denitrificans]|uniref:GT2 family glycosyltransferase n=1 Tax=Prolixibacter denitrificans TaxID=1541063 RepID=A0A2P8CJG8_9BACT|nr:glycosyltransferase [Prolixibacter denitrificans]PSK85101.1 GT2 family glycosyltransferase [Prolixibacter denitrificans]GET23643.1 hypothetical protein JCM18694_38890 [Prolixibacter denitrificans]
MATSFTNDHDMKKLIIITPIKDSLETLMHTIDTLRSGTNTIPYYIFDDFSNEETIGWLNENQEKYQLKIVHLSDYTSHPSPNYRLTLNMARKMALEEGAHLAIIESDVIAQPETLEALVELTEQLPDAGLVGSVTTDSYGNINFPYSYVKKSMPEVYQTPRSMSFCCTVLSNDLMKAFDFAELDSSRDWYDVYITKRARQLGFSNYISLKNPVIHKPHGSRPWKMLKYKNPILYYLKKFTQKRDRI